MVTSDPRSFMNDRQYRAVPRVDDSKNTLTGIKTDAGSTPRVDLKYVVSSFLRYRHTESCNVWSGATKVCHFVGWRAK